MKRLAVFLVLFFQACAQYEGIMDYDDDDGFIDESELVEKGATGGDDILLGWSSSGLLTTGDPNTAVQLQSNFDTPGNYTLQFSVQGSAANLRFAMPVAEIIWSVEGNSVRRVVSVNNGLSVTGCGQGVKVKIVDACYPGGGTADYTVSVQVTPGIRPSEQQPPTYVPLILSFDGNTRSGAIVVAAAGFFVLPIPEDIGAISIYTTATSFPGAAVVLTEANVRVQQVAIGGLFTVKGYDPRIPQWVPLSPMATSLVFENTSATAILFSITFGIDG